MKRSITRWTMAAAAAAVLAVPTTSAAQTSGTSTPQTQSPTSTAASPQVSAAAREHLSKAKAALNDIDATKLDAKARTQVTEIKKRMTALERVAGMNDSASATGQANRSPAATATRGNVNWGTEVAAIDKALTTLLGPASTTGATGTTTPPPAGTSGAAGSTGAKAGVPLDETTRAKLTEMRTHVTAFATAMAGGKTEEPAAPASTAAAPTATTATTGTAPSTTATPQPPAEPQSQPQTTATPQVDETAARRHLTEARNTLSAMTQLPAASQLQGEARTQVSQLITNFNELITTQVEWRATYAKLEANLTALLGPDMEAAASSGTAAATGTTGTTGTTGATAGTSGTVELDPGIREKLVELRRNLNAFEKAAGGGAAASAAMTSGTTPATASAAATTPTSTPSEQTGMQTAQSGNADVMKHVAAIEALIRMQDDSGGLTLTKAQVEELRTHWAALRAALEKR